MKNKVKSLFEIRICYLYILLLVCSLSQSCTEIDGDWDAMKWESEINISSNNEISVPAEGGQITLRCTNYKSPWLCDASEIIGGSTSHFQIDDFETDTPDYMTIHTNFATIRCVNNNLIVNVLSNDSEERILNINVTAGDIFDSFTFIQESKKGA